MKIRGRFIAILGLLGILVSTMTAAPAIGASAGTIALTGGVSTDDVRWYGTLASSGGNETATVTVVDSDKNALTALTGECDSGALTDFKCVLVGTAGAAAYQMPNTFLEDSNNDDLPDNLLVRGLQSQTSGFITTGTSAATGAITLGGNLGTAVHAAMTGAVQVTADGSVSIATQNTNTSRVRVAISNAGNVTGQGLEAASGITVGGTVVHATTLAESAGTEVISASLGGGGVTVASVSLDTTKYFKAGTVTVTIDVNGAFAGNFSVTVSELGTVAARYSYNQVETLTGLVSVVSSSQTAVAVPLTLTETNASSGTYAADIDFVEDLAQHNTANAASNATEVYVTDGALITATYADEDPDADKTATARIDIKAPTIALTGPVDGSNTNVQAQTFIVVVTDEASADGKAAGITSTDIDNIVNAGVASANLTPLLIGTNQFQVSYSSTITAEGAHKWWIPVKDKLGNTPVFVVTDPVTAIPGAGDPANPTTEPADPFIVAIDTAAPTNVGASTKTGGKLTTATTTPFATTHAFDKDERDAVSVTFALGAGTAPLDPATLSAADWSVGGTTPSTAAMTTDGTVILLTMATDQATDATPKVELVTAGLKDLAGNSVATFTGTSGVTAVDDLEPVLTVTSSSDLAADSVTVTVNSSEALGLAPTIKVTETKPANNVVANTADLAVTQSATTTWTGKYTNAANNTDLIYVVVAGTDTANLTTEVGDDSPVSTTSPDLITFQVDDAAPTVAFTDAAGNTLASTDQQEGSIWIVATFDEDEYTGDTYKTVTVSAIDLEDEDAATVTTAHGELFSSDDKAFTLAVDLTPGDYTYEITAIDDAGNEVTDDVDFTVVAQTPFSLTLKPGVNLVSVPGTAIGDGANINTLLGDKPVSSVVTYDRSADLAGNNPWLTSTKDAATDTFSGDITTLEPGVAYFITATASTTAKILISQPEMSLPPTIGVRAGFNAIGFWSISGSTWSDLDAYLNSVTWTVAYSFDPTPGVGWTVLRPDGNLVATVDGSGDPTGATVTANEGKGYLVYVSEDGTLTP